VFVELFFKVICANLFVVPSTVNVPAFKATLESNVLAAVDVIFKVPFGPSVACMAVTLVKVVKPSTSAAVLKLNSLRVGATNLNGLT
jgi:Ni,Fe-hydrogenase III large subunit